MNNWCNKIIVIYFFTQISFSQIYELGVSYGKSNFIGDIGNTRFINPIDDAFGGIFKWNRSPRHSYRLSYIRSKLSANDLESSDPRRIERGYYFETPIDEFLLGMEFNFFDFDLHESDVAFSPYIFSGISYTSFKDQLLINSAINSLENKNWTFGIPMILGIKYRFYDNYILSIEIGDRYTFSDKIDGNNVSNDYLNYNFGNINNNDWYMFTKINLTYTFGRNPCYCNIGR